MDCHRWYIRWAILVLGLVGLWYGLADGDKGLLTLISLGLVAVSCYHGTSMLACGSAIVLGVVRNFIWATPVMRAFLSRSWFQTVTVQVGLAFWEAIPLLAAFLIGCYLLRRKAPSWMVLLIPAGLLSGLGVWIPRQYNLSFGAMFADSFRGVIWLLGADLAGGMLLGWILVAVQVLCEPKVHLKAAFATLGAAFLVFLTGAMFQSWSSSRLLTLPKTDHTVIALQGAVPPFAAGYAQMYERALYPMILLSTLKPDLVILPENMVQASKEVDEDSQTGVLQRHFTAVGMGVAVPSSQVAFGVRDFETSRIYWTDVVNGKADVIWKDLQHRLVGVDYMPAWMPEWLKNLSWTGGAKNIMAPKEVHMMNLHVRDIASPSGLKVVGRAIPLMSGEVRSPRLVEKILNDRSITVGFNPCISGWLGASEARTSSIQARARFLELGLVAYRVGQLSGTEFYVPWRDVRDEVTSLGKGSLRFTARLPEYRVLTGYTAGFWFVSFYLMPLLSLGLLGWWIGRRQGWIPA